jgi:hypothetical protein
MYNIEIIGLLCSLFNPIYGLVELLTGRQSFVMTAEDE